MIKQNNSSQAETTEALNRTPILEGDRTMWIIYAVLIVVSILVVYSSTAKMVYDVTSSMTSTESLRMQIMLIMVASLPVVFITHKINHTFYNKITPWVFWICVGLTLATYFFGESTNGAARWIAIGPVKIQPSELLKISTILMLARNMEARQRNIDRIKLLPTSFKLRSAEQMRILKENSWPLLGPVVISCGVIAFAHVSSALIIGIVSMLMLYIGRVNWRELLKVCFVGVAAAALLFTTLSLIGVGRGSTASTRLETWITELFLTDGDRKSVV